MRKHITWILSLGVSITACAQNQTALKYSDYITAKDAKKHLSILASDKFEGRETGTRGAEMAAEYIAKQFKKIGLKAPVNGSYFQDVPLVETSYSVSNFAVNGSQLSLGKDFLIYPTNSVANTVSADEIVFIGYGISDNAYDDLAGVNLAGKIVMYFSKGEPTKDNVSSITKSNNPSDWSTSRSKKLQNIMLKSPALIIAVNPDVEQQLADYKPRSGRLGLKSAKTPSRPSSPLIINTTPEVANRMLKNSGKTYTSLKSAIDNSGSPQSQAIPAKVSISYGPTFKDVKAVNVMGYLEGTDLKDEVLVFSGHYDHIGLTNSGTDKVNNGADDDGSGTTAVLEIARAFAKAKKKGDGPRRSILFLTVVGEEKGLLGSEYYSENPVFPLANTITDLNIDMIGRTGELYKNNADSTNYCYLIGSDKLSTDLHKISETANATYTNLKIDYKYNDPKDPERIYYRSDHYNFAKHNIPIIFYFNGVHEDYHQPGDEVEKINFPLLEKRAKLVFFTGWELANRDKRPVVDVKNDMPSTR